ncbi:hypothetical protein EDC94DRAFT_616359 [Helicostylum pulchrum]|nr:hypothetical protein EDC94DRAFT_616359 [Helicostylum pulchrum]
MSTTTEPIVTEQVTAAAAAPQVVEAPAVTESVKVEEPAKIEEPVTVADEVAATEVTEAEAEATAAPTPTTSKSNPTNRLSLFLGKAKTFVDKKVHEKKPALPKKDNTEEVTAADATAEPVVADAVVVEEPVAVEEPVTREVETTKVPKTEKRKSILAGIFRSKSPVKEVEKSEDVAAATPATTTVEEIANETTTTDKVETPAAAAAVVEEEPVVAEHTEKENVLDQIKRSPLGKLFKQKKEAEHKEAHTPEAPVIAEPDVVVAAAVEETPVVVEDVVEPAVEAPVAQEKVARSGSPLGRRITQMFRGFSSKKKVPTVADTEDANKEEGTATREIATDTAVIEQAPVVEQARAAAEDMQQEKPEVAVAPAQVPAAQPTA